MVVNWKKYFNSNNPIIDKYLQKYGFQFLKQTFEKIKKAESSKRQFIYLIKFIDSDIVAILHKNDYKLAMNMLLDLCIRLEFYELCSEIKSYINKPQRKRRKVTNVTKKIVTM